MFKRLLKNKKAQQTAEYALLISLVIAAVVAMQTYAQRSLQARIRDAGNYLATQTSTMGSGDLQYEPYYLEQEYEVTTEDTKTEIQDGSQNIIRTDQATQTRRAADGYKTMSFNRKSDGSEW